MARDIWIDRTFAQDSPYRVRELCGTEIRTLATFAVREAAEQFIDELERERSRPKERDEEPVAPAPRETATST